MKSKQFQSLFSLLLFLSGISLFYILYGSGKLTVLPALTEEERQEYSKPVMQHFKANHSSPTLSSISLHKWGKEDLVFKVLGTEMFEFVAALIVEGLRDLGFEATAVGREIDENDSESIYIQTWSFYAPFLKFGNKNRFILYNWEQLRSGLRFSDHPKLLINFHQALEVWDYSLANVEYLRGFGVDAKLIVPGYSLRTHNHTLTETQDLTSRRNEVGFSGSMNPRRENYLQSLQDANISLFRTGDFSLLTQSKLVVNIHSNSIADGAVLEVTRMIQLLPLKIIIVSERSSDKFLDDLFAPVVTFFDSLEECVEKVHAILSLSEEEYVAEAERRYQLFKSKYASFAQQLKMVDSWVWHPGHITNPTPVTSLEIPAAASTLIDAAVPTETSQSISDEDLKETPTTTSTTIPADQSSL